MKILIAEDEVNIAESYKLILEFKGHEVTLTGDGEKCLDVYKQSLSSSPKTSAFDLIILDYRMPKKDGVQVAQEILGITPSQRILLATAFVHDLSISRLQEIPAAKAVELIQKPFDFDNFLNIVSNHSGSDNTNSGPPQINRTLGSTDNGQNEGNILGQGGPSSTSAAKSFVLAIPPPSFLLEGASCFPMDQDKIQSKEKGFHDYGILIQYNNQSPSYIECEYARLRFW